MDVPGKFFSTPTQRHQACVFVSVCMCAYIYPLLVSILFLLYCGQTVPAKNADPLELVFFF